MPNRLIIFVIVTLVIFLAFIIKNINNKNLSIKNSLIWIFLVIALIISCFEISSLQKVANLIGIETVSNMFFFLGFCFLVFICFSFSKQISYQSKRITVLTQEVSLLRKMVEKNEK